MTKKHFTALLLDTNILLEVLFKQERSKKSLNILQQIQSGKYLGWILDFSIYSIAIAAKRANISEEKFEKFLKIITAIENLSILHCPAFYIAQAYTNCEKQKLDFDDALHYTIAKENKMALVSYDKDFKKTDLALFPLD